MTAPMDELDRRIAAGFEDAPGRVSERTIDAVLAHANAHPRRRDPFAGLRRDPMGREFGSSLRPLPLVLAAGLLIAAAIGGAVAGGFLQRQPSVVVPPVVSPSPSVVEPSPSPSVGTIHVDLIEHEGRDASIDITDSSSTLLSAVSGDPASGASTAPDEVLVENDPTDPSVLVLTWSGSPCDTTHELSIAANGRDYVITRPDCSGDAIPVSHVLRLVFATAPPAADVRATLVTTAP